MLQSPEQSKCHCFTPKLLLRKIACLCGLNLFLGFFNVIFIYDLMACFSQSASFSTAFVANLR